MKSIEHIGDHLERGDAEYVQFLKLQEVLERKRLIGIVIRLNVAMFSILCAVYAIYMQF